MKISPPTIYKWFIAIMFFTIFLPVSKQIHFPFNLIGLVPFILGSYVAIDTKRMFKKTLTPLSHLATPVKLHTDGVFRFTRNPMYLGISIGLAGIAILTGIIYNLVFSVSYLTIMHFFFVRREEEKLENELGESYQQYKKQTRRWL
ncbi:MAG: isoprenylcysteine carboxylmethyltransferase family protein [Cyclobacteriaceae bacterium]